MGLFKKATKNESKLRLAIAGPSGSGKTYSALAIATGLGGPIAVVDTEHGSASKYADLYPFDVLELHAPYHPDKYIEAIQGAAQGGYNVIVLDSMSHAWNGEGGLLELVEQATKRQKTPNSYTAWGDVTPIQNRLIEAIVSANIHIIATMRSKQEYVQEKDERGKSVIRKVGMAPIQRDGFEYEFDIFFDMDVENNAIVSKTRCPELTGKVFAKPGAQVAKIIAKWLSGAPAPAKEQSKAPRQVDTSTGEIVDSLPVATDVIFQAEEPASHPVASQSQQNRMHALGQAFHGSKEAWEAARPVWVKKASGGRAGSSKDLSPEQSDWIIASLEKRLRESEQQQAQQPIASAA